MPDRVHIIAIALKHHNAARTPQDQDAVAIIQDACQMLAMLIVQVVAEMVQPMCVGQSELSDRTSMASIETGTGLHVNDLISWQLIAASWITCCSPV